MLKRTFEGWTDENVAILRQLVQDGASANEAGIRLGCSRNAAIGKASRLDLVFHSDVRGRSTSQKVAGKDHPKRKPYVKRQKQEAVAEEIIPVPVPVSLGISLVALTDDTCRWPLGYPTEETFGFCGNESPIDSPYCNFHHRMAYRLREPSAHGGRYA